MQKPTKFRNLKDKDCGSTSRRKFVIGDPPSCAGGCHPNTRIELLTSNDVGGDGGSGGPGDVLNEAA